MSVIHTALDNFLQAELTLSTWQITQGSKSHLYIRSLLGNKWTQDPTFPRLIDGDFLSGSYARGTKIFPLDDIDVMMVIDGAGLYAIRKGETINAEVRGSSHGINPVMQHLNVNGLLSSRKVIELFCDALRQSHPNSKVKPSGQAVNVQLANGLGIDVVPCFHIIPRNLEREFYYIPIGGTSDYWLTTNPKIDAEITEGFDLTHDGKFKGLVRLVKHWNKVFNAGRLRSYHLETLTWWAFQDFAGQITQFDIALLHFFRRAQTLLAVPCPDATQLGEPVDGYLMDVDRQTSLQKIAETIDLLFKAGYLFGSTNEATKLHAWKLLLGEQIKTAA